MRILGLSLCAVFTFGGSIHAQAVKLKQLNRKDVVKSTPATPVPEAVTPAPAPAPKAPTAAQVTKELTQARDEFFRLEREFQTKRLGCNLRFVDNCLVSRHE